MSKSPPARIETSILVWARASGRPPVEEAAAKMKLPEARLQSLEVGDYRASVAQLSKHATIYRQPVALFFLSETPHDFQAMRDFPATAHESLLRTPTGSSVLAAVVA